MKRKIFLFGVATCISFGLLMFYQYVKFFDNKLHIVFCNVGQGDAIYIRTPKAFDILVDGGPDDKILSCLSDNMPFWDRTIDLIILTHPHADHVIGLIPVVEQYKVMSFATEALENDTVVFTELKKILKEKNIVSRYLNAFQKVRIPDGVALFIVGPTTSFLQKTSPGGIIGESEFASLETLISYGAFSALLNGDSQAGELQEAIELGYLDRVDILQVPHHGSKTGLTDDIIKRLYPKLAVISVGKNKYGHPTKEVLKMLHGIKVLRTDQNGDIEVVSDGKKGFIVLD